MCNGGGVDPITATAILGVVVVGGIITSPVWVPGAILYGTGVGVYKGVQAAQQRRTTHVLRKVQKRLLKRLKAGEWQSYLQLLMERCKQEPDKENLHEFGVAMIIANDMVKAEEILTSALEAISRFPRDPTAISRREASILFARGMVNQELRDYRNAVSDFQEASRLLECGTPPSEAGSCLSVVASLEVSTLPPLTPAECLNSLAYSKYLLAMYEVMQPHESPARDAAPLLERSASWNDRIYESKTLLKAAIEHENAAIEATQGDPRGMFFFNRGKFKYYLALLTSMHKGCDDVESVDGPAIKLSTSEEALVSEASVDFQFCVTTSNFGTTAEGHAMRAQALAVLGDMSLAEVAAQQADDIDPKVFLVDLTSPEQLSMPWPLPPPLQSHDPHKFEEKRFHRPHYCDHCIKLISNFTNAYCCTRCQFRIHRGCLEKAGKLRTCWKEKQEAGMSFTFNLTQGKEVEAPETHVHSMMPVYFHKPTWCDACQNICLSPHGYRCTECRFRVHGSCVEGLPNCVLVGVESKLKETGTGLVPVFGAAIHCPSSRSDEIRLVVRTVDGFQFRIQAMADWSIRSLKIHLANDVNVISYKHDVNANLIIIAFGDAVFRVSEDELTLAAVGIESGSVVFLVFQDRE